MVCRQGKLTLAAIFLQEGAMYWTEQIVLMQDTPEKVQGVTVHKYTPLSTVYGEKKAVKWSEFFAAEAAGTTLSAVFSIHADEYHGEKVVQWEGNLYSVQRAYKTGDKVELSVSDLPQTKGALP